MTPGASPAPAAVPAALRRHPWVLAGLVAAFLLGGTVLRLGSAGGHSLAPDLAGGLLGRYFPNPNWSGEAAFSAVDPQIDIERAREARSEGFPQTGFSIEWTGAIVVGKPGTHRFWVMADDGAWLWIDGTLVVDNGGIHRALEEDGEIELSEGQHSIRIRYDQGTGDSYLKVRWQPPDGSPASIPSEVLLSRPESPVGGPAHAPAATGAWSRALRVAPFLLLALGAAGLLLFAGRTLGPVLGRAGERAWSMLDRRAGFRRAVLPAAVALLLVAVSAWLGRLSFGLDMELFPSPVWEGLPRLKEIEPPGLRWYVDGEAGVSAHRFGVRWTGSLYVPRSGLYTFALSSNNGAALDVDGLRVIDAMAPRPEVSEDLGRRFLDKGYHPIQLLFSKGLDGTNGEIRLAWQRPDGQSGPVPAHALYPGAPGPRERFQRRLARAATLLVGPLLLFFVGLVSLAARSSPELAARAMRRTIEESGAATLLAAVRATRRFAARQIVHVPLLAALAAALIFGDLWRRPLTENAEVSQALLARKVAATGQWWSLDGRAGLPGDRPAPALTWLAVAASQWLGESDASGRLPAAAGLVGIVLIAYVWGTVEGGAAVGLLAAVLVLAMRACPEAVGRGTSPSDPLLAFAWALGLVAWRVARGPAGLVGCGFALGAASLVLRGGGLVPLAIVLLGTLLGGMRVRHKASGLALCTLLALGLPSLWYGGGGAFTRALASPARAAGYLTGGMEGLVPQALPPGFWEGLSKLASAIHPWGAILLLAFAYAGVRAARGRGMGRASLAPLVLWAAGAFWIVSMNAPQVPEDALPLVAPAAILIAIALRDGARRAERISLGIGPLVVATGAVLLLLLAGSGLLERAHALSRPLPQPPARVLSRYLDALKAGGTDYRLVLFRLKDRKLSIVEKLYLGRGQGYEVTQREGKLAQWLDAGSPLFVVAEEGEADRAPSLGAATYTLPLTRAGAAGEAEAVPKRVHVFHHPALPPFEPTETLLQD